MKLSEVDEWSNKDVTVDSLFRVQASRSLEFVRYFNFLMTQHPTWTKSRGLTNAYVYDHTAYLNDNSKFRNNASAANVLPLDKLDKLCKLRERMLLAKSAFEDAGGDYDKVKRP